MIDRKMTSFRCWRKAECWGDERRTYIFPSSVYQTWHLNAPSSKRYPDARVFSRIQVLPESSGDLLLLAV